MNVRPPLTLYVHLPWCVQKCPYCDFNSHALKTALPEAAYIMALKRDFDFALASLPEPRPLEAIFFGGGTPSLFSAAAIGNILEHVRARLPFSENIEITLEANPGTIERERFADYRAAGINRASLGVQSFDNTQLKKLGRIHDSRAAHAAIEELHAAGLMNFNLDLMYALPGQNRADALHDIERAIAAKPAHISHYELTLEPNTLFAAQPPADLPDDDSVLDMLEACQAQLEADGFQRYEISAYAKPGRASRHNLNYWRFGDYLAIGAGAHGKLTDPQGHITRTARIRHPKDFLTQAGNASAIAEIREPDAAETVFEFMLNVSRLTAGSTLAEFARLTGLNPALLKPGLGEATRRGLIRWLEEGAWQPTPLGMRMLNDFQAIFLPNPKPVRGSA